MASGPSSPRRPGRITHPGRVAAWAAVLLAALCASFLTGRLLHAPERTAVEQAQRPIPVTVRVEERIVDARTALAGSVIAGTTQQLGLPVLPDPAIVTRQAVAVGDTLRPGALIGAVSGQPLFALPGPLALYRDLRIGDRGDDVTSLQRALRGIGAEVRISGTVDQHTLASVARLFGEHDFPAPTGAGEASPATPGGIRAINPDTALIPRASFIALTVPEATVVQALPVGTPLGADSPLATVQTSPNIVSFRADAVRSAELTVGQEVEIQAGDSRLAGEITTIGEFAEAAEGKTPGRDIAVTSPDPLFAGLTPGLSVTVLPQDRHEESLAVPTIALRRDAEGSYLLTPGGDSDTADTPGSRRIPVTVRYSGNGWTAISAENLRAGTEVALQ